MPNAAPIFRPTGTGGDPKRNLDFGNRRGSARARGYSSAWDAASTAYRAAHPLCLGCQAVGRVTPADVTDHVVPPKGMRGLFWNDANWQAACAWHHDQVKQMLERRYAAGELTEADLRLDSAAAIELTRRLDQGAAP